MDKVKHKPGGGDIKVCIHRQFKHIYMKTFIYTGQGNKV